MNEGKVKIYGCTLFAMLLATGSCIGGQEDGNEGLHTFGAEAIYFFGDYTSGVRKG
jgi:hypothetical protein